MKYILILFVTIINLMVISCSGSQEQKIQNEDSKYIKGVSAALIYEPLRDRGFKIDKQFSEGSMFVNCDRGSSQFNEHLRIAGDGPEELLEIRASYTNFTNENTNNLSLPFFDFLATLPYVNSNPEIAKKWINDNISKNSKTEINGVCFEIFANAKRVRTLLITPKK